MTVALGILYVPEGNFFHEFMYAVFGGGAPVWLIINYTSATLPMT